MRTKLEIEDPSLFRKAMNELYNGEEKQWVTQEFLQSLANKDKDAGLPEEQRYKNEFQRLCEQKQKIALALQRS